MASINMKSIEAKLNARMSTSEMKKNISSIADKGIISGAIQIKPGSSIEDAADKFIEVLQSTVASHAGGKYSSGQLGPTAVKALTALKKGEVSHVEGEGNLFTIGISFSGNLSRKSIYNDYDEDVENIAALLNNGYYFNPKRRGHGFWHGNYITALNSRSGTGFMEEAERVFMASFAEKYNVKYIEFDDIYYS